MMQQDLHEKYLEAMFEDMMDFFFLGEEELENFSITLEEI